MVYNSKTLEILHPLSERGKEVYAKFLEQCADDILFKSEHPIKWAIRKLKEKLS